MLPLLPDRPRRRREGRIRERAYRDGHNSRRGLRGVEDGRAAVRTEVEEGAVVPSSETRMYCREAPSVVTRSASNRAWTPKTLPVRRWQARQWQIETRTGSPSTVSRSCPQLHAACRVLTSGIVDRVGSGTFPEHWPRRGHGFDVERLGCAATETIKRPDNSASQPTSGADHRRLRADPRRGWARRRRGSRGPLARPRSLATYRAGRAPRPTP